LLVYILIIIHYCFTGWPVHHNITQYRQKHEENTNMITERYLLVALLMFAGIRWAGATESTLSYYDLPVLSQIIPAKTQYYTIAPSVRLSKQFYVFQVTSNSGESMEVTGILDLLKTCQEISIIEDFRTTPQGNEIWKGAKGTVSDIGDGAKQIVAHPGDSIGGTVSRTGRSMGRIFTKPFRKEEKSSTGEELSKAAGGFAQEQARAAAYDLQLDAYSKNPLVRDTLASIGRKRWLGKRLVSTMMRVAPGAPLLSKIAAGAGKSGTGKDEMELLMRNFSAPEVSRSLLLMMARTLNAGEDSEQLEPMRKFVDNPNFTPRQKAYATLSLQQFSGLRNFHEAVTSLAAVKRVEDAEVLSHQLRFLLMYHNGIQPLSVLSISNGRIAGVRSDGLSVLIFPYDYIADEEPVRSELAAFYAQGSGIELWLIGSVTDRFRSLAQSYGVSSIHENLLSNPVFHGDK